MSEIRCAYLSTAAASRAALRATSYAEQTTDAQRSFSSTNANDNVAGTGARTLEVVYYNSMLQGPFTEMVNLNGTTPVDSSATDICLIEKMEVIEVGSTGGNAGTIRIHTATAGGGSVFASIGAGDNRTRYSHHYVADGKNAYIQAANASCVGENYLVDIITRRYSQPVGSISYAAKALVASFRVDKNSPPSVLWFPDPFQLKGPAKIEMFARADTVAAATVHADLTLYET